MGSGFPRDAKLAPRAFMGDLHANVLKSPELCSETSVYGVSRQVRHN